MKILQISSLLGIFLLSGVVNAANVNSNVGIDNQTTSSSTSAAQNAGNAQSITFNSESPSHQTLRNTPGVILGGFSGSFSSDYCGATGQGGIGLPGFSFAAGGPVIDEKCVQLRTFERTMQAAGTVAPSNPQLAMKLQQAAIDMLCLVSDRSQAALSNQGLCSGVNITNADHRSKPIRNEAQQVIATNPTIANNSRYNGNDPIVRARLGLQ